MSTAHIFYIPIILLIGIFAGYFIGRYTAEQEELERRKRVRRRKKAAAQAAESEPST